MKLRLPNALKVALMAATSGLVFTTLSTGSGLTAVAVGAAALSQTAAADDEEGTTATTYTIYGSTETFTEPTADGSTTVLVDEAQTSVDIGTNTITTNYIVKGAGQLFLNTGGTGKLSGDLYLHDTTYAGSTASTLDYSALEMGNFNGAINISGNIYIVSAGTQISVGDLNTISGNIIGAEDATLNLVAHQDTRTLSLSGGVQLKTLNIGTPLNTSATSKAFAGLTFAASGSAANIGTLSIVSGNTVTVASGRTMNLTSLTSAGTGTASLTNNGTLNFINTGTDTSVTTSSNSAAITGSGTVNIGTTSASITHTASANITAATMNVAVGSTLSVDSGKTVAVTTLDVGNNNSGDSTATIAGSGTINATNLRLHDKNLDISGVTLNVTNRVLTQSFWGISAKFHDMALTLSNGMSVAGTYTSTASGYGANVTLENVTLTLGDSISMSGLTGDTLTFSGANTINVDNLSETVVGSSLASGDGECNVYYGYNIVTGNSGVTIADGAGFTFEKDGTAITPVEDFDGYTVATRSTSGYVIQSGTEASPTTVKLSDISNRSTYGNIYVADANNTLTMDVADFSLVNVVGAGNVTLTTATVLSSNTSTQASGKLTISGTSLQLGNTDTDGVVASIASFTSVEMQNGAAINRWAASSNINSLTVTGDNNLIRSVDTDTTTTTFTGTTNLNGTLTLASYWNSAYTFAKLTGAGTLNLRSLASASLTADPSDTTDSGDLHTTTLQDLSGFTGTVYMSDANGNLSFAGAVAGGTFTLNKANSVTVTSNFALTGGSIALASGVTFDATSLNNTRSNWRNLISSTSGDGTLKLNAGTSNFELITHEDSSALTMNSNVWVTGTGGLALVGTLRDTDKLTISSGKTLTVDGTLWSKRSTAVVNGILNAGKVWIGHEASGNYRGKVILNDGGSIKTAEISFRNNGNGNASNASIFEMAGGTLEFTQDDTSAFLLRSDITPAYNISIHGGTLKATSSSWFVDDAVSMTVGDVTVETSDDYGITLGGGLTINGQITNNGKLTLGSGTTIDVTDITPVISDATLDGYNNGYVYHVITGNAAEGASGVTSFREAGAVLSNMTFDGKDVTYSDDTYVLIEQPAYATSVLSADTSAAKNAAYLAITADKTLTVDDTTWGLDKISGTGNILIAKDTSLNGSTSTAVTGALTVRGVKFSIGSNQDDTSSISSYSSITLENGAELYYANKSDNLSNVTVASGHTGYINVNDMGSSGNYITLAGTTTVDGTLELKNLWNAQFSLTSLAGSGELKVTNSAGTWEDVSVTINDLSAFTGTVNIDGSTAHTTVAIAGDLGSATINNNQAKSVTVSSQNLNGTTLNNVALTMAGRVLVKGDVTLTNITNSLGGSDSYALVSGDNGTSQDLAVNLTMAGTIDLTGAGANTHSTNIGLGSNGKLIVADGASVTIGRFYNSSTATKNGSVEIGNGATLTLNGASTIYNLTNNGTLTQSSGTLTIAGSMRGKAIDNGSNAITINNGVTIYLNENSTVSYSDGFDDTATSYQTGTETYTLATGDGTVTMSGTLNVNRYGVAVSAGTEAGNYSLSDDKKSLVFTASSRYNIAEADTVLYTTATADSPANINVLGTLQYGSSDSTTDTSLSDSGVIGTGTVSLYLGTSYGASVSLANFDGTTLVNTGNFTVDGSNAAYGSALELKGGVNMQVNNNSDYTLATNVVLDGSSEVHQNGGKNLTFSGTVTGTNGTYVRKGGGTLTFSNTVNLGTYSHTVGATTNFNGASTTLTNLTASAGGTININSDTASLDTISLAGAPTVNILAGTASTSKLYSNGAATINIGDASHQTTLTATRMELSDNSTAGNTTSLTVTAGSVLKITGSTNESSYKTSSAILGEWAATATANIYGTLLAKDAQLLSGDAGYTLNIEDGATVATKGIDVATKKDDKNQNITVNLNGGKLLLGESGINNQKRTETLASAGGTIASYAGTMEVKSDIALSSDTTTVIDTEQYSVDTNANTVGYAGTASTITVSGVISGKGKLKVTGTGAAVLSGANTYEGGTEIAEGHVTLGSDTALGSGTINVSGTSTIDGGSDGATLRDAFIELADAAVLNLADITLNDTVITGTNEPMVTATNVTFNGGTVTLGTADASVDGGYAHNGTLTVTGMTVSSASTLNANLSVSGAMTFGGVLDMGCDVNFTGATTITLSDSMAADVWKNGKTAVLTSVESSSGLDYTDFNGKALVAVQDEGASTYTIYAMVPEPATATLSLLALAGLCARRRRK